MRFVEINWFLRSGPKFSLKRYPDPIMSVRQPSEFHSCCLRLPIELIFAPWVIYNEFMIIPWPVLLLMLSRFFIMCLPSASSMVSWISYFFLFNWPVAYDLFGKFMVFVSACHLLIRAESFIIIVRGVTCMNPAQSCKPPENLRKTCVWAQWQNSNPLSNFYTIFVLDKAPLLCLLKVNKLGLQ